MRHTSTWRPGTPIVHPAQALPRRPRLLLSNTADSREPRQRPSRGDQGRVRDRRMANHGTNRTLEPGRSPDPSPTDPEDKSPCPLRGHLLNLKSRASPCSLMAPGPGCWGQLRHPQVSHVAAGLSLPLPLSRAQAGAPYFGLQNTQVPLHTERQRAPTTARLVTPCGVKCHQLLNASSVSAGPGRGASEERLPQG